MKKKNSKNSQLSTVKQSADGLRNKYFNLLHFEVRALPDSLIPQFCQDYVSYYLSPQRIEEKNGLTLKEFLIHYGMPTQTFYDLMNRHEIVKFTHERVKEIIATRRENGMCYNVLNYNATSHTMRQFDQSWFDEWKLKKETEITIKHELEKAELQKESNIKIEIPCFKEHKD